jgi:hypothetical protein
LGGAVVVVGAGGEVELGVFRDGVDVEEVWTSGGRVGLLGWRSSRTADSSWGAQRAGWGEDG